LCWGRSRALSKARRNRAHKRAHALKEHSSELFYAPQPAEQSTDKWFSLRPRRGHLPACPTIERPPPHAGGIHQTSTWPEASILSPVRLGTRK
jgi:hypothetical protein